MQDLAQLPLVLMPADYCLRKNGRIGMCEGRCASAGGFGNDFPEGILQAVAEGTGGNDPSRALRQILAAGSHNSRSSICTIPRPVVPSDLPTSPNGIRGQAAEEFAACGNYDA